METQKCDRGQARAMVVTGTDISHASEARRLARILAAGARGRVQTLDWNHFFLHLLDPTDTALVREDSLSLILVRFEDWDHFREYALNRSLRPSYEVVEKKVHDMAYAMECASARCAGRCLICILPCSPVVREVPELVSFFQETIQFLKSSLSPHDFVRILELSHEVSEADSDAAFTAATAELQAEIEAFRGASSFLKEGR